MSGSFPGVDPYLESQHFWADFHHRFMNYWCEVIADRLPDHYDARLEEWVEWVESTDEKRGRRESDLAVSRQNPPGGNLPRPGRRGDTDGRAGDLTPPGLQGNSGHPNPDYSSARAGPGCLVGIIVSHQQNRGRLRQVSREVE